MTTDIFQQVEEEAREGAKKRVFPGFKNQLRFNDGTAISINTEVRYGKLDGLAVAITQRIAIEKALLMALETFNAIHHEYVGQVWTE